MGSDGRSYVLEEDAETERVSLFETQSAEAMATYALKLLAHRHIESDRDTAYLQRKQSESEKVEMAWWPLLYVWLTGLAFGASAAAAVAIYLGKLSI